MSDWNVTHDANANGERGNNHRLGVQPHYPGVTTPTTDGGMHDPSALAAFDSDSWSDLPTSPVGAVSGDTPPRRAQTHSEPSEPWEQPAQDGHPASAALLSPEEAHDALRGIAELWRMVQARVSTRVFGMESFTFMLLSALLAGVHVLIEGDPGEGKTSLVTAFSQSLDLSYGRIQCTSDKLPSDATGFTTYLGGPDGVTPQQHPIFLPGPVFAHIVHVDEINRASGGFQSGLLEAMAEGHVTPDDGKPLDLPKPNLFVATQNTRDPFGINPLPMSQKDRFGLGLRTRYPAPDLLRRIIDRAPSLQNLPPLTAVPRVGPATILYYRRAVAQVHYSPEIVDYMVRIFYRLLERYVRPDDPDQGILTQAPSPRAGGEWLRVCQAAAALNGDEEVRPHHVTELAPLVLAHRLIPTRSDIDPETLVEEVLEETPGLSERGGARPMDAGRAGRRQRGGNDE